MSSELKPCPFCGSDDVSIWDGIERAACENCGTCGPSHDGGKEEAARLWNERAGDGSQPEIEYTAISADGSKIFVVENGEVKEHSLGEDYRRLFGEKGITDEV